MSKNKWNIEKYWFLDYKNHITISLMQNIEFMFYNHNNNYRYAIFIYWLWFGIEFEYTYCKSNK